MSYKFDSLIMILNKLDSKEVVTINSLMNDIEVSERTAYRYLQTLQVEGFPIVYERERGCYTFNNNYSLRKPNISIEESLALALSKKLLKSFGSNMEKSLSDIENKLSVKQSTVPRHIVLSAEELPSAISDYLSAIHRAIINFQRLEMQYKSLYLDEETCRKVDPYYLFYHEGFWHLRGYCHLRDETRTFALDRILSLKTLNEYFIPTAIIPEEELSGSFGAVVDREPVEVALQFDAQCKPYILRKKWHHSQEVKELSEGKIEMRLTVNGIEEIKQWIYRWLPHVEVKAPMELKEVVVEELAEALQRNRKAR